MSKGKAAPDDRQDFNKYLNAMSCSVVKDVDIQETRAGMERARKKQGHLKTLGRLVLYAPTPHPLDGLLQWTVRPLTDVDNLPVFLDPLARLTTTQRCTNVALSIRDHRPHLFNVFARVEGGEFSYLKSLSAFFSENYVSCLCKYSGIAQEFITFLLLYRTLP